MSIDEVFTIIVNNIYEISGLPETEDIGWRSMLSPMGLDSIGRAELIEKTLEDLGLSLSAHRFYEARNIGELAELFFVALNQGELKR